MTARKPQTQRSDGREDLPTWLASDAFTDEEVERYRNAAHRCGLQVSHWARQMLNAAAREVLDLPDSPRHR